MRLSLSLLLLFAAAFPAILHATDKPYVLPITHDGVTHKDNDLLAQPNVKEGKIAEYGKVTAKDD